ncbi:hypothetical protein D3C84_937690 [compost metagenome]
MLLASTFITRSVSSRGGKRTRRAMSMPSWIRSTWRLVLSMCSSTSGYSTMKRVSIGPTQKSSSAVGQLMRTTPWGSERLRSITSAAPSASTIIATQWR